MLEQLLEYGRKHGEAAEPGFAPKDIRWAIECTADGRFLEVHELGNTEDKNNPGQRFPKCPELGQNELVSVKKGGARCHFLAETAQVVALFFKENESPETIAKNRAKHKTFVNLLQESAKAMPALGVAGAFLADPANLASVRARLKESRAKPTDKITLRVEDQFVLESDAWHGWWRTYRASLRTGVTGQMRCFATGEMAIPVAKHLPIKGLRSVGGGGFGDVLVCFDKDAFRSYGLKPSENGAVSEEAMCQYRDSLNALVEEHSVRLVGTKVVYWFKQSVSPEDDPFSCINTSPEQEEGVAQAKAREILEAIRSGERPDLHDNLYYAMTVSGASGRVMVRDWTVSEFRTLVQNINYWFDDLEICSPTGLTTTCASAFEKVATCVLRPKRREQDYLDWVKPITALRPPLWHAALFRTAIPFSNVQRLPRLQADFIGSGTLHEIMKEREPERTKMRPLRDAIALLQARMALLKAYHIRKDGGRKDMQPILNEEHPHVAYQCGRLMSVLADLQYDALGDVGAGVVQRYYAAASATPALVLGRLIRTAQFHIGKSKYGYLYEDKLAAIWSHVKDNVPATLALEEQTLFALGYYQQMAHDRAERREKIAAKREGAKSEPDKQ
jgi:CRISPR-associated protein Csd1